MPHQRARHLLVLLNKRLSLFPVVGVLGARQTGKSTLLRDLLPSLRKSRYVTLDRDEVKGRASAQPTLFIQNLESADVQTVCVDEIQKVPKLFDTIKAEVDERRRPGRFAVSGSTEFSKKTGVQESLTGRIALLRLYPLNGTEIAGLQFAHPLVEMRSLVNHAVSLKDVSQWLTRGGMPGVFALRDSSNREAWFESWIETTCSKDLAQFNIARFNPELARRILEAVAHVEVSERAVIAQEVGKTPRQIESYLQALKALFVLYEIEPYKTGTGKPRFYFFDSGIGNHLGASSRHRLKTWFLNELYSQFSYYNGTRPHVFFYRTSRGSEIDFVVESKKSNYAVLLSEEESPRPYSLRSASAFLKKHAGVAGAMNLYVASPCLHVHKIEKRMQIIPWNLVPGG